MAHDEQKEPMKVSFLDAVRFGKSDEVRRHFDGNKVDLSWEFSDGSQRKLLHLACSTLGSAEVVRILLDHGADINATDSFGSTPLFYAAANGHLDIVNCLIERGADVHKKDTDGFKARERASTALAITSILRKHEEETLEQHKQQEALRIVTEAHNRNLDRLAKILRRKDRG